MPHSHKCYFHKSNKITHFCCNIQCTLPMCSQCLPIHVQQHPTTNQSSAIISFTQAEQHAITQLKNYIHNEIQSKEQYLSKIQSTKKAVILAVNQYFQEITSKIFTRFQGIAEAEKKLNKIQKGSLKTLIYYYSQQKQQIHHSNSLQELTIHLSQIQKQIKNWLKDQHKSIHPPPQHLNHQIRQFTHQDINQCEQPQHPLERGYSFDSHHQHIRKQGSIKSTIDARLDGKINNPSVVGTTQLNNKNLQRSVRAKSTQKHIFQQKQVSQKQQHSFNIDRKLDTDQSRRKQIQLIRKRQEQRQHQRKKKQIHLKEEQDKLDREKQRQRQKQQIKIRQIDIENQRIKNRQIQLLPQRNKLRILQQDSQNLRSGFNRQTEFYPNPNTSWNIESDINKTNLPKEPRVINFPEQQYKKPLQINDLNTENSNSKHVANIKISRSTTFTKGNDKKPGLCQNLFSINKQVLSPDQIRKMLQKRIQQRSRLISKSKLQHKNNTPSKSTDNLHYRGIINKNKQFVQGQYGIENDGKWDTKDSIIHQIYQDYRN